jgi:GNAT superfamily N-acetyltransferase
MTPEKLAKIRKEAAEITEAYFGTHSDPDQMQVTQESRDKFFSIHKDVLMYRLDEKENLIGWSIVIPTSLEVMNKFLHKEITESQLLDFAVKEKKFEALYLCIIFVLPEFRRKGYAREMFLESISKLSAGKDLALYCWIYSDEGGKLVEVISKELGRPIVSRD